MTANITRFTMDLAELLAGRDPNAVVTARRRAAITWPAILGFALGCRLGAACEAEYAMGSLALPTALALIALLLGYVQRVDTTYGSSTTLM